MERFEKVEDEVTVACCSGPHVWRGVKDIGRIEYSPDVRPWAPASFRRGGKACSFEEVAW